MDLSVNELISGPKFTICELCRNGTSEIKRFFDSLDPNTKTHTIQLIEYIANNGTPANIRKFNYEEDGIWAIKRNTVRLYCFFHKNQLIIITNGAIKKTRKANPRALDKAKRLRNQFLKLEKKGGKK